MPNCVSLLEISKNYDAVLLDAFGVLVNHAGALAGAADAVRALRRQGVQVFVVTNDASRHPERAANWYRSLGIECETNDVISSGSLLANWVREHQLEGAPVAVLGTADSRRMLEEGGALAVTPAQDFEAIVLCDEAGFPMVSTLETVINALARSYRDGKKLPVALANPDLIYPRDEDNIGLAVGSVALIIDRALEAALGPRDEDWCDRLGKPFRPIFAEAERRAKSNHLLMVGDQLSTDIAGALNFGIDAALVTTGIHRGPVPAQGPQPTFLVEDWGLTEA